MKYDVQRHFDDSGEEISVEGSHQHLHAGHHAQHLEPHSSSFKKGNQQMKSLEQAELIKIM